MNRKILVLIMGSISLLLTRCSSYEKEEFEFKVPERLSGSWLCFDLNTELHLYILKDDKCTEYVSSIGEKGGKLNFNPEVKEHKIRRATFKGDSLKMVLGSNRLNGGMQDDCIYWSSGGIGTVWMRIEVESMKGLKMSDLKDLGLKDENVSMLLEEELLNLQLNTEGGDVPCKNRVFVNDWKDVDFEALADCKYVSTIVLNVDTNSYPEVLGTMRYVKTLHFQESSEALNELDLSGCNNLKELIVANDAKGFPKGIEELENLKSIRFRTKSLRSVPENVFLNKKIEYLQIDESSINELPDKFDGFEQLKRVRLNNNRYLKGLPDSFDELKSIYLLDISDNSIETLPTMTSMHSLVKLNLMNNKNFNSSYVFNLPRNLEDLCLSGCNLKSVPVALRSFPKLKALDIRNNKGLIIPKWVWNYDRWNTEMDDEQWNQRPEDEE